eukprot:1648321-Alexandrium_andersonii.AAC.1
MPNLPTRRAGGRAGGASRGGSRGASAPGRWADAESGSCFESSARSGRMRLRARLGASGARLGCQ